MSKSRKVAVIGLGYVGLTTAVAFSKLDTVIAFDKSKQRIDELKRRHDRNNEILDSELKSDNLFWTAKEEDLKQCDFYIISVPTPIDKTKHPDMSMLLNATEMVGRNLKKGDIVVYESSVYPGATEEKCIPLLESVSKLICKKDFSVGFSPERVNPADKDHTFYNVIKIVSATDKMALDIISGMYAKVVKPGVYLAQSIRIAEAAKIIENTQRDVNIALMNDIAILLHTLGIDTSKVIDAMSTKWNFVPFKPGLVGGHCIGINSYYLMHKAEEVGYHSDLIFSGRRVNEFISKFIVGETIKKLIHFGFPVKRARVAILGLTYKPNCSDIRDTRVIDIIKELESFDIQVLVHDPIADREEAKKEYAIDIISLDQLTDIDAVIVTMAHKEYVEIDVNILKQMMNRRGLLMDINEIFDPEQFADTGIIIWRL